MTIQFVSQHNGKVRFEISDNCKLPWPFYFQPHSDSWISVSYNASEFMGLREVAALCQN